MPGHYDLDLVVYSRSNILAGPVIIILLTCKHCTDLTGHQIVREGFDSALGLLERVLDRKNPHMLTDKDRTSRSRQFIFDRKIEVDMLVSPHWGEHPQELYQFLQKIDSRERSK